MKHERRIIIRNKQLRNIRNNLREIIIRSIYDEIEILSTYSSLYGAILDLTPEEQKEVFYLEGTKHELRKTLHKSVCVCPLCSQSDKDMVFIPLHETWYCVECQEKDLIWYPSHRSEEDRRQHDYINWYLEQKEKFMKRFLNKDKSNSNK
ncbi:MAG: hypothetical protein V3V33_10790 [Candidatus Lokiarchaeia archaeon]